MINIDIPTKAQPLPGRNSVILYMADDAGNEEPHEFHVRGAIAWPMPVDDARHVRGYAVVLGQDVLTGGVHVFEERDFVCIDHIIDSQMKLRHEGLAQWINMAGNVYCCRTFYYHQPDTTHDRWRHQVRGSKLVTSQPEFIEVLWREDAQALNLVWERSTRQSLTYWGGPIADALTTHNPKHAITPELWALMVGLNGMDLYAWRKPTDPISGRPRPFPRNPLMRRLQNLSG